MSTDRAETLRQAAELLDREVASEEARLTTAEHPDPWMVPMLGNWLGGIRTAAQVLRDEAERDDLVCRPGQPAQTTAAPSAAGGADGGAGRG